MIGDHRVNATMRAATAADTKALATVLAAAFHADAVAQWIEPDDARRRRILPQVYAWQAREDFLPHGVVEVIEAQSTITAAAVWTPPGNRRPPGRRRLRRLPAALRLAGRRIGRVASVTRTLEAAHPEQPHWTLAMLGVDPRSQGSGLGRALVESGLARCDAESSPAYLDCVATNVALYERFGFTVTRELRIPHGGPAVYTMWRVPHPRA